MRKIGSALRIGLSRTGAAVVHASGWLKQRGELVAEFDLPPGEASIESLAARLDALLKDADLSRLPARIVLSDRWVRRAMVAPPRNAASLADCRAAAEARFLALYGESMPDWQLAADWDAEQPFLACALPSALLAALQQVAKDRDLILQEIAPQSVVAWNRWRREVKPGTWLGVLHRQSLTLSVAGRDRLAAAREVSLPENALRQQSLMPEILAREALRLNLPQPSEIRLCGQVPSHWVMQKIGELAFVRQDAHWATASHSDAAALALTGVQA